MENKYSEASNTKKHHAHGGMFETETDMLHEHDLHREHDLHALGELKERACDSLVMCIVTTMNQGLRNGGGIGDILRAPSSSVSIRNF